MGLAVVTISLALARADAFDHFVTAENGMLKDGAKTLRFLSYNVPNLNYIEDDMRFRQTNPYRLPTEYEMRDVFQTVAQMGGQVIRIYTVPVKNTEFPPDAPTYVLAPGTFNEEAFKRLDLMMALANHYGIRIIFPLVNNWPWMGGRPQYAAFRGKTPDQFWTDEQLIADFEVTIRHLLERTNTVTGVKYKDDKAILCWETGNELSAPFSWTKRIARYIKSIDGNHLVMDGSRGDISNRYPSVQSGALTEASIDIVTTHHYESDTTSIPAHIQANIDAIKRQKVYIVGEFGFAPLPDNKAAIDKIVSAQQDVAGALLWSLRFHNDDGGFYWHTEPAGNNLYRAFLWPGFASGEAYNETALLDFVRKMAFAIQGKDVPAIGLPPAPQMPSQNDAGAIWWRGSPGASGYDIERANTPTGAWAVLATNVPETAQPYFPTFNDETAKVGSRHYYRVRARNSAGISAPSNAVGPILVSRRLMVDRMQDLSKALSSKNVQISTGGDRSFKELPSRLAGEQGSEIVYHIPGGLKSLDLYAFQRSTAGNLQFFVSTDGHQWSALVPNVKQFPYKETNYDYWTPTLYHGDSDGADQYLKIVFGSGQYQLGRAEFSYN